MSPQLREDRSWIGSRASRGYWPSTLGTGATSATCSGLRARWRRLVWAVLRNSSTGVRGPGRPLTSWGWRAAGSTSIPRSVGRFVASVSLGGVVARRRERGPAAAGRAAAGSALVRPPAWEEPALERHVDALAEHELVLALDAVCAQLNAVDVARAGRLVRRDDLAVALLDRGWSLHALARRSGVTRQTLMAGRARAAQRAADLAS